MRILIDYSIRFQYKKDLADDYSEASKFLNEVDNNIIRQNDGLVDREFEVYGYGLFTNISKAKKVYKIFKTFEKDDYFHFALTSNIEVNLLFTYIVLLLQYLGCKIILHGKKEDKIPENIINKYTGQLVTKQIVLQCQKELIDAGYAGNAHWGET